MKNYEKYGRELKKYRGGMFCDDYVKPDILKLRKDDECDHDCVRCLIFQVLWLLEEDEESEVDWNKVAVDTPVLVGDFKYGDRYKRYFAEYENGIVYTWDDGYKSYETSIVTGWKYAELAEVDKETGELKVDWDKVEIDTPILVRDFTEDRWEARHFAKYENGEVYAWVDGQTSWTGADEIKWKYAKLAEGEKDCEEPEVDWNQVEVDTPILVRDSENTEWLKKYFAKYENGHVYVWNLGRTSWTAPNDKSVSAWSYAKLAESEESEVDWSEVKIDTLIMVRDSENGDWFKRYFAEYKNGKIYTWDNGHTSWETSRMIEWKYAKLVEDEK